MKRVYYKPVAGLLLALSFTFSATAQKAQNLVVQVNKPVSVVQPTMWGVFFEDINFSADGGIYAELIKNRSFEFFSPLMGWKEVKKGGTGKILINNHAVSNSANPRFARFTIDAEKGSYGIENEGFRGIGVQKDKQYNFSILVRSTSDIKLRLELLNLKNEKIGESAIIALTDTKEWKKYTLSFNANSTEPKAKLAVLFEGKGVVDADMISLFPQDTWKNRPGGLRADLVQMLADLKPGFIRFPGGCIVEGRDLENRYQWKTTVGPVEDRKLIVNRWNTEFKAPRNAPDYFQSYGLGFFEYFQLAEDLKAEPLPILNCGMACQYNTGEVAEDVDPYIQDALDLIEFANGPVTSKWGKLRAEMGHPASFNLKYLGVGNEQWDVQYIERYKEFDKVLRVKHPEIKLVSGSGPSADGALFDYAWKELKTLKTDLVDEHYYKSPEWFFANASRYDNYDRKGPKVFAGEYAAHGKDATNPESKNTWLSALAEASFMTGLERNADVVHMASYAPLLAHVEAWQWRPDLIWFDNLKAVGTPNYYVQKLFSSNKGTHVVPVLSNDQVLTGKDSVYSSATIDRKSNTLKLKIVNTSSFVKNFDIQLEGASAVKGGSIQTLSSADPMAYNSLDKPQFIVPVTSSIKKTGERIPVELKPKSVNVISLPYRNK